MVAPALRAPWCVALPWRLPPQHGLMLPISPFSPVHVGVSLTALALLQLLCGLRTPFGLDVGGSSGRLPKFSCPSVPLRFQR